MPIPKSTQLGTLAANGQGTPVVGVQGDHVFAATVTGAGSVSATVQIMGSNDLLGWTAIATLSPSGTSVGSASASIAASHSYWRADVSGLTAGASVRVSAASEEGAASGGSSSGSGLGAGVVGPYVDALALQAARPAASSIGVTAYVGASAPYALYRSDGSAWSATGGGGATTFSALTDKATVDLPATNTPLATALSLKAPLANPAFSGTVSGITSAMVGLSNVDNTSDANKPTSTAAATALALKAPLASPTFTGTVAGITSTMVGLGSVDNTSDANKPVSTAQAAAIALKQPLNTRVDIANQTANVTLTASTTVDVVGVECLAITQTTTSVTITLPAPTTTTLHRAIAVENVGSVAFTVAGADSFALNAGESRSFRWNGTNWKLVGTLTAAQTAAVQAAAIPNGIYLGASFPKRGRRGTYGRKVASWGSALQNSAGTTSFVTGDLPPFADNATRVLRLDQNAAVSFGQQSLPDGGQAYMPKGAGGGQFTSGVWVKNPGSRTLDFATSFYNPAANRVNTWNGACEPGGWRFLTFSPTQNASATLIVGTDAITFVRVAQKDNSTSGPWLAGEYLLFGNVYVDVAARPRFCLTFDDGLASQSRNNPSPTSKVSGSAHVASTLTDVLTTAAAHGLVIGEPLIFTETAPSMLTSGTTYYVKTVPSTTTLTLATDTALSTTATTTGFAGTAKYQYGGTQDRSCQGIVESYGFRGSIFVVPLWLGTSGTYAYGGSVNSFLSTSDVLQMWQDGWAVGSHSYTHPSNSESAGLRLLGPYGYYLSNTFDNLAAQYISNFSLTATNGRRRVTAGTQASPSVLTTENAHQFLVNQPIVFTDVAPTGFSLGVTYYVKTVPSGATFTLATDQGTLAVGVNNTIGAWTGTSNYRWPGSAADDSAIYADIMAGVAGVAALGIPTGGKFFALPQGAADEFVRSACIRAGLQWIRGISGPSSGHTIPIGVPSGGGVTSILPGGWIHQLDAVQTDGVQTLAAIDGYVTDTINQGACGCNYHHGHGVTNMVSLDRLCKTLRTKVDAGAIDVLTCDELAKELGF